MKIQTSLVQNSPEFFNKEKTLQKVEDLVNEISKEGSRLIVFPESFIPGYPRGFNFGSPVGSRSEEGRDQYADYFKNSFDPQSKDMLRLVKLAKENNTYLVIGVTEKGETGSLFCSMLYISPKSGLLGIHRKIKPTGAERLVWSEAAGDTLVSFNTDIGKLGGLICWENYMPLARMAMYRKGVEIYIAPTADARERWSSTMIHIALEGRCFVLGCNQFFTKAMIPDKYKAIVKAEPDVMCKGGSIIVSPFGEVLAGPLFGEIGVLTAEIDLNQIPRSKLDFDVAGHYSRDDIFKYEAIGQPEMIDEKEIV